MGVFVTTKVYGGIRSLRENTEISAVIYGKISMRLCLT